VATPIIDQSHDPSYKRLFSLVQEFPHVESYIKTAHVDEPEEEEKLASSAFAWKERRLFRIDKPDQAALSRLYMHKQAGIPEEVVARCDQALDVYGITLDLGTEKVAAAPDDGEYLLPKMKRFRVRNADDVKTAAVALLHHCHKMNPAIRATAAVNLVKKANEHNIELSMPIYKLAGVTMCNPALLGDWVEARAEATKDPAIKRAYTKLAEATRNKEAACQSFLNNRPDLIKLADSIMELDEAAGLTKHYDRKLPDPMLTVFNTEKIAEEMLEVAGKPVEVSRLLAIDPDTYRNVFGEDLANEFIDGEDIDPAQLKIILPTVPLDLQQALAAQMGV
jgi:hypothetical protein